MIMAREADVEAGLDGAEHELSARPGEKLAEPGEVDIARRIAGCAGRVKVIAFASGVPQFDQRASYRIAAAVEDASGDVGYDTRRNRQVVVELDQIVVFIEGDVVGLGVVRALSYDGRRRERLGQVTRKGESSRGNGHAFEEAAAVDGNVEDSHLSLFGGFCLHHFHRFGSCSGA